jgi:hypothetical protein
MASRQPLAWRAPRAVGVEPVEAERRQIERWRQVSPAEKAAVIAGLTNATFTLVRAGVRREPQ